MRRSKTPTDLVSERRVDGAGLAHAGGCRRIRAPQRLAVGDASRWPSPVGGVPGEPVDGCDVRAVRVQRGTRHRRGVVTRGPGRTVVHDIAPVRCCDVGRRVRSVTRVVRCAVCGRCIRHVMCVRASVARNARTSGAHARRAGECRSATTAVHRIGHQIDATDPSRAERARGRAQPGVTHIHRVRCVRGIDAPAVQVHRPTAARDR